MMLNLRKGLLGLAFLGAPLMTMAQTTIDVAASSEDASVIETTAAADGAVTNAVQNWVGWVGADNIADGDDAIRRCYVIPFKLPEAEAGVVIESVSLEATVGLIRDWFPLGNVADLYAIAGARAEALPLGTDYFNGAYNTDDTDAVAIQQGFVVKATDAGVADNPTAPFTTSTDANALLKTFIQGQYDAGNAGKYVFLRVSTEHIIGWQRMEFSTTDLPVLSITGDDKLVGAPNTPPVLEDIEDVVASTVSSTSVALDVTDAEEDAGALVVSVTKADGSEATGMLVEKHWNGSIHFITIDGSVATAGDYEVTVTDAAGATAVKTVTVLVDDTGANISGRNWPSVSMGDHSGVFTKSIKVTPNGSDLDAGVTMSEGELGPDSWGDCSVIVRFKPDGTFDAHNGVTYASDAAITYETGVEYTMDFTVDVPNKKYTVSITPAGGTATVLATDYGFRNQNVEKLDHVMLAAYIRSYTLEVKTSPVLADIEDVVASTVSSTSVALDVTDADEDASALVVSVTKADGSEATGMLVEKHWNGSIHFITIDGAVATEGEYEVTVTDADGATAVKPFNLLVDATGTFISGRNWPAAGLAGDNTGVFTKSLKVIPNGSSLDAGVTMSEGKLGPDSWGDCSVIVRFKPDGTFDAHNGVTYTKDADITYESGVEYTMDFTVDVPNKTYTVSITPEGGTATVLATDYGFRNQNVTQLDHVMLAAYIRSYTLTGDDLLSNELIKLSDLSIYPNPVTNGVFAIETPDSGSAFTLDIIDVSGKVVYNKVFTKTSKSVIVSDANLNSGLYIVKLSSERAFSTQKLVVK